jgi:hypothetical protein
VSKKQKAAVKVISIGDVWKGVAAQCAVCWAGNRLCVSTVCRASHSKQASTARAQRRRPHLR